MTLSTSSTLLERLRAENDPGAWERFVKLYTPLFYSWACRQGMPREEAADLVQDVFTVLAQKMPEFRYDRSQSFRAWLKTVTLNKWRDWCKRRRVPVEERPVDDIEAPDDIDLFVDGEYQQHLTREALRIMQSDFPEATWKACWETQVNGRSANDVAEELGISVKAVYSATYRVLCRLRHELRDLMD